MPRDRERMVEREQEREMKMPKKGPWTVAEDTVLVEYIAQHGEGNWNTVERNSGLMRCGKSCRLRWFNHLRPNLKRGAFSPEEEKIVVEMHAQFGNRWARMATKLPGRSDNEIKNFWNTRAKRLERAGLPLYPEGLIARHHPIRHRNQNHTPTHFVSPNETHFSNPNLNSQNLEFKLSPHLSMGPFSYSRPTNPNPIIPNSTFSHYSSYPINGNGSNFSLGSSSNYSPFSSIPSSSTMSYPFQSQSYNLNPNPNPNPPLSMSNLFEPQCLFSNDEGELSLIQSLLDPPPAAYESSNEGNFMEMANFYDPQCCFTPLYRNDGLLEDICGVNNTLAPNDEGEEICMWDGDFSSSPNTSIGMQISDPIEEMFPFYDDLSDLLENFPMDFP